eukprot:TRINITY_DN185_c0_g1_i2.p1 TRINITY_DN185_c0_g1~~TRINITY_DN185_c0_g1_i2.p1  ORF type:complete len:623 (+),score=294.99 TRINITY_DN185_c0_g1_i2:258-2126(+)
MPARNEPITIDIPQEGDVADSHSSQPSTPKSPFRLKDAQTMALSWHDLVFEVDVAGGPCGKAAEKKQIVKGASGECRPGTLTALMGPSGAGKTTMMNVLAGRAPYGEITSGKVVLNGLEANPADYQRQLAYVMQQDAMFATQTPREALNFTATLRLPEYSEEQREEIVNSAITALRLEHCADTMIGSVMIPGLSGGEKKRAAVAVELISSPSLIFLDEPTSGLDSHSAYELVMILKSLAESGCTIVCTIHQPSSEVFALFHNVVCLRSGNIVYQGSVEGVASHFETDSFVCKNNTNPSDFAMQRLQMMDDAEMETLMGKLPKVVLPEIKGTLNKADLKKNEKASVGAQMWQLLQREFKQMVRDRATLAARFGMGVMLSLMIGCIFYDVGSEWGDDADLQDRSTAVNNHWGALVFLTINGMFLSAQPMVLAFPLERAAFIREYTAGTYSATAYLVAKSMLDVPAAVVQQLLSLLVFYFLTGMNGNFALMLLATSALAVVSASIALMVGAVTTSAETAVNLLPAIYVPQILFSGFFVSSTQIPDWLRWLQWGMPLKYGINLATTVEFTGDAVPSSRTSDVDFLITRSEMNRDLWWRDTLIMVGMFLILRVLTCLILSSRAKKFE